MKSKREIELVEEEIKEKQKIIDYQIREFPVSVIVEKFQDIEDENGKLVDKSELFIPDYQREYVWSDNRKSKFIESLLLGLPIPYLFVADVHDDDENEGRLEIVDGAQRIQTLSSFLQGELVLANLKKLKKLNGFEFNDLSKARQLRFNRTTLRMIELTEKADEEVRRDLFERINTGSEILTHMEVRKGAQGGRFYELISKLTEIPLFNEVCPISETRAKRAEKQELVLRFFAYTNNYLNFKKSVTQFLDNYLEETNKLNESQFKEAKNEFVRVLEYVKKYFPNGFRKFETNTSVPRIRFEAISVGVALALRENPNLGAPDLEWLTDDEFSRHTRSDASNSVPKVRGRIEYVRDHLLSNN